ncbi:deoxyribodipyrimidine photo-lyase, partial [Marinospirillum sp.]|uniref:deoxyribodipyrimidine photo-lyase n=1 Tax=Marinospirillum sp. TaxID=2183934 RepID=UPI0028708F7C
MPATLVWYRADLRSHDNPALVEACRAASTQAKAVIAVFLVTPQQWLEHGLGSNQAHFLLRNFESLSQQLNALNIPLKFLETPDFQGVPQKLTDFCAQHQISDVYCNQQYEWNERQRDRAVAQKLSESGAQLHTFTDQVIFSPGQILTGKGDYYTVFTPFYRNWISQLSS